MQIIYGSLVYDNSNHAILTWNQKKYAYLGAARFQFQWHLQWFQLMEAITVTPCVSPILGPREDGSTPGGSWSERLSLMRYIISWNSWICERNTPHKNTTCPQKDSREKLSFPLFEIRTSALAARPGTSPRQTAPAHTDLFSIDDPNDE